MPQKTEWWFISKLCIFFYYRYTESVPYADQTRGWSENVWKSVWPTDWQTIKGMFIYNSKL